MADNEIVSYADLHGKTVRVYRNLSKGCWSIQSQVRDASDKLTWRVMFHAHDVFLSHVTFKVSEAGRLRVLREKRKNVHAYAHGTVEDRAMIPEHPTCSRRVFYNPYERSTFVDDMGEAVAKSDYLTMDHNGKLWAHDIDT